MGMGGQGYTTHSVYNSIKHSHIPTINDTILITKF